MQIEATTFPVQEPNQNLLLRAYFMQQICLVLAIQIVLINLLSHVSTIVGHLLPAGLLAHAGGVGDCDSVRDRWRCSSLKLAGPGAFNGSAGFLPA